MDEFTLNLKDAGLKSERISEIRRLYESGDIPAVIRNLRVYRRGLMTELRKSQEKVDCLDFLLRKIGK